MDKIIAYCGLTCTECEAYLATQANDRAALERVAAKWREEYHNPNVTVEYVICDGCLAGDGRLGGHCPDCDIRVCAVARGVTNCAHCDAYGCDRLEGFFSFVPTARAALDAIRLGLVP